MFAKYPSVRVTCSALSVDAGAVMSPATVEPLASVGSAPAELPLSSPHAAVSRANATRRGTRRADGRRRMMILHKVDRISRVFLTAVRSTGKSEDPLGFGPVRLARFRARVRGGTHDLTDDVELGMRQHRLAECRAHTWPGSPRERVPALASRPPSRPTRRNATPRASPAAVDDDDGARARRHPGPRRSRGRSPGALAGAAAPAATGATQSSSSTPRRAARSRSGRSPASRRRGTTPPPTRAHHSPRTVKSPPSSDSSPGAKPVTSRAGTPSDRSITVKLLAICMQKPRLSTKRNCSTVSAPSGSGGMSSVYFVFSPSHDSSARIAS